MYRVGADGPDERAQVLARAHPLQLRAGVLEPRGDAESLGLVTMAGAGQELGQAARVALPERDVPLLLHRQPLVVPLAREQRFPGEQRADLRVVGVLSLEMSMGHDV